MRAKLVIWGLLSASPLLIQVSAQAKKKIFIITDAEGVAGVCSQEQTDPHNSEMQQLLTGEIMLPFRVFLMGVLMRFSFGMRTTVRRRSRLSPFIRTPSS